MPTQVRNRESAHGTRVRTKQAQVAVGKAIHAAMYSNTKFGDDLLAARWDIEFFADRFLGVKAHPSQRRLWRTILLRDGTGWRPRYLDISVAAGNRAGKTLGIAIPMLHSATFKIGLEPPNPVDEWAIERWG